MSEFLSTGTGLVAAAIGVGLGWAALDVVMFVLGRAIAAPSQALPKNRLASRPQNGAKATSEAGLELSGGAV